MKLKYYKIEDMIDSIKLGAIGVTSESSFVIVLNGFVGDFVDDFLKTKYAKEQGIVEVYNPCIITDNYTVGSKYHCIEYYRQSNRNRFPVKSKLKKEIKNEAL